MKEFLGFRVNSTFHRFKRCFSDDDFLLNYLPLRAAQGNGCLLKNNLAAGRRDIVL